jgi:hypothetical protein
MHLHGDGKLKRQPMRLFLVCCLLILCASFIDERPQRHFYEIKYNKPKSGVGWVNEMYPVGLENIFTGYVNDTLITISLDDLQDAECYDFSKLKNMETLNIMVVFDPYVHDSIKEANLKTARFFIPRMSVFSKCPNLKRIVFVLMDTGFVTEKDCPNCKYDRCWKKQKDITWNAFGKDVQEMLPGIPLYVWDGDW